MSDVQHTHEINTLETFLSIRFANSSGIILLPTGPHAVKCFCLFGLHMASYGHGGGTLEPSNLEANPLPPPPIQAKCKFKLEQTKLYDASNGENIAPNEQFNIQECISQRKSTENAIISCVFTFEHLIAYTIAFTFVI